MDRNKSTISREIKHNTGSKEYRHKQAHNFAKTRHVQKNKRIKPKERSLCGFSGTAAFRTARVPEDEANQLRKLRQRTIYVLFMCYLCVIYVLFIRTVLFTSNTDTDRLLTLFQTIRNIAGAMKNSTFPFLIFCSFLFIQLSGCSYPLSIGSEAQSQTGTTQSAKTTNNAGVAGDAGNTDSPAIVPTVAGDAAGQSVADLWQHLREGFSLEKAPTSLASNARIKKFELWYSARPLYFERMAKRAYWILPYVLAEIEKRGMPAEIALVPAVESAYRHAATSHSNAVGLWQMISATGRRFGLRQDWWMDGRRDLVHSTRAALDYFDYLSDEFDGDWLLALAAYNSGEGTIRRQVKRNIRAKKTADYWSLTLSKETSEYVPKLLAIRNIIDNPGKYGITLKSIPNTPTLAVVNAHTQTDLAVVATLLSMPAQQLNDLNMGYKRGLTPPDGQHHIVVPINQAETLLAELNKLTPQQRMRWSRHRVRQGEHLSKIAHQYRVSVHTIMVANQLASNLIHPNQELKIPVITATSSSANKIAGTLQTKEGDKLYTIKPGDSLWGIARHFGASLSKLLRWNGMTKKSLLYPGQRLIVGRSS